MSNRQGQKLGPRRGNLNRFPYEPRVVGGKLFMPAELQAIHRYVVETPVLKVVTDELRQGGHCFAWLKSNLPPRSLIAEECAVNTDPTIRQIEFELEKAEHGLGMPYDAERVGQLRKMLIEARKRKLSDRLRRLRRRDRAM